MRSNSKTHHNAAKRRHDSLRGCGSWLANLVLAFFLLAPPCSDAAQAVAGVPEYNLKAGYLITFTQYTTWPTNAFPSTNSRLVIGVLGNNPFGQALDQTAQAQKSTRPLTVRNISTPEEAALCHVVFLSKEESRNEAQWLEALKDKPVLTVGESGQTIKRGGIIEFVMENKRVRFDASSRAMSGAKLKISSQMLGSARKVHKASTDSEK